VKIYFDNCSIQRPLDDKSQVRVAAESEIILSILSLIGTEIIRLVSSETLIYEVSRNSNIFRREFAMKQVGWAKFFLPTAIKATCQTKNEQNVKK